MFTLSKENRLNTVIPDQDSFSDTIYINRDGILKAIQVAVSIQHPYMGDISVKLLSPSGTEITLRNREGGSANDMDTIFEGEALLALVGESTKGAWILTVQDHAAQDNGLLDSWGLNLTCDEYESYKSEIFIADSEQEEQLTSTQECRFSGRVTKAEAEVELEHPLIGDLVISIVAPSGKEIIIHDRVGGSQNMINKKWSSHTLSNFIGESSLGTWTLKIKSFHTATTGTLKHWKIRFHYEKEDDLKVIEGIGPKLEGILKSAGIYSYVDLAAASEDSLTDILQTESDTYQLHDPKSWPPQAMLAAQGRWVDLEALKDDLH